MFTSERLGRLRLLDISPPIVDKPVATPSYEAID